MSINSSLIKLADKIDTNGKSSVSPEYKNPNNSIEKSLQRIADTFDASHKSTVTPEYRNPNNSIERSLERIADTYTSGGGGGDDDTFDVLFEIDPQTPSARLVKGHFSDIVFDQTAPNIKVGAYINPYASMGINSVAVSVTAFPFDVDPTTGATIAITVLDFYAETELYYQLNFATDDTVEIEAIPNPFPPSIEQITLQRGYGSATIQTDICQYSHNVFECGRVSLSNDGFFRTIAPILTHFYDSGGEIINSGITFNPADAGSYNGGNEWLITKSCSIIYTPTNDPLPPA